MIIACTSLTQCPLAFDSRSSMWMSHVLCMERRRTETEVRSSRKTLPRRSKIAARKRRKESMRIWALRPLRRLSRTLRSWAKVQTCPGSKPQGKVMIIERSRTSSGKSNNIRWGTTKRTVRKIRRTWPVKTPTSTYSTYSRRIKATTTTKTG